jgi:hypothetical protein
MTMTTVQASRVFLGLSCGLVLGSLLAPVMARTLRRGARQWCNILLAKASTRMAKTSIVIEREAHI